MAKTIEKELTPPNPAVPQPEMKPPTHWPLNSLLAALALAAALLSLGITLYNAQEMKTQHLTFTKEQFSLQTKQEQLINEQQKIPELIESQANALARDKAYVQEQLTALDKQLNTALSQKLYQNQDWLLLKVRYYLELAQINNHWSDNYSATVALLQAADSLLSQINEPKIFTIRQVIAKEIAQLQATPVIDFAGILSQLDAAQTSIDSLIAQLPINDTSGATANESAQNSWQANMSKSLRVLEKLVVIRHNDHAVQPLLSPAQEALLKEQIRLNLEQAQWAILNKNPEVYQLALSHAISKIKKGFNEHTENVSVLLKQLGQLQDIKLSQEKPADGQALPLLNALIDAKKSTQTSATNGESK